jgi:hypothetical protein
MLTIIYIFKKKLIKFQQKSIFRLFFKICLENKDKNGLYDL